MQVEQGYSIQVTDAAQDYFRMLVNQEEEGTNLRLFVSNLGTIHADISMSFCPSGEEEPTDIVLPFEGFTLFIEKNSQPALEQAMVDFKDEELGGKLSIKAPHLKPSAPDVTLPLQEQIQYVLDSEVNPNLATHGGKVSIDALEDDKRLVLRFSGGCQGCSMSTVTMKNGIERVLKEKFPQLIEVVDATDHETGDNPYC